QALLLRQEEARAIAAIPAMLPEDPASCAKAFAALREVVLAQGELSETGDARLAELAGLFGVPALIEAPEPVAPPVAKPAAIRIRAAAKPKPKPKPKPAARRPAPAKPRPGRR
ncbi:MAG: hypothetical protein WCP77_14105, partial [Roseococcus sp.]